MKKLNVLAILLLSMMLVFTACGKKQTAETEATETETQLETSLVIETATETEDATEAETEEVLPEGMMYSYLTGEVIDEKIGKKRPYAIMINNIHEALPQSGVEEADIIYEAEVEGGITRLLALFQDVKDIKKIGSIRSARHYYIDFANENEAIYVHYGQSTYAQDRINRDGLTTIHGLSGYEGSVFYRSSDRKAPHNVYTTGDMLAKGLEITGLSRKYSKDYKSRFKFYKKDTDLKKGEDAETVKIPFDSNPKFKYNTEDGLYYRSQYGEKHIDRETDHQLAFKNIIVQYVSQTALGNKGHQELGIYGSGKGFYITNGKAIEITWERDGASDVTKYYNSKGKQIHMNQGKTFIEIVSDRKTVTFK